MVQLSPGQTLDAAVLIPAFNADRWLDSCIASALNQGVRSVLVWDDGSTDLTATLLAHWADRDPRVRFRSAEHRGVGFCRNALAQWAIDLGITWLNYLDADDVLLPGKIARQLRAIDPDTEAAWCDLIQWDYTYHPPHPVRLRFIDPQGFSTPFYPPLPGCWLLHRSLFETGLAWDNRFDGGAQEWALNLEMIHRSTCRVRTPFYGYLRRAAWSPSQITARWERNRPEIDRALALQTWGDRVWQPGTVEVDAPPVGRRWRSHWLHPFDSPEGYQPPRVLLDLTPFENPVDDRVRLLTALRLIAAQGKPLQVTALWPWGDGLDVIRSHGIQCLTLTNCAHPASFDHVTRTGREPMPGTPIALFDSPLIRGDHARLRRTDSGVQRCPLVGSLS